MVALSGSAPESSREGLAAEWLVTNSRGGERWNVPVTEEGSERGRGAGEGVGRGAASQISAHHIHDLVPPEGPSTHPASSLVLNDLYQVACGSLTHWVSALTPPDRSQLQALRAFRCGLETIS